METKTYYTMRKEKANFGPGPWDTEPDKMQFQDEATGLACLIVRNSLGALCGYVGVPEGHPLFGQAYDEPDIKVHGGLTFADRCSPEVDEAHGICHVPAPGEPDHVWWFGFDCGHGYDLVPYSATRSRMYGSSGTYRDIAYVKEQITRLAKQLKDLEQS